jgi:electron transport complex protein RnfB
VADEIKTTNRRDFLANGIRAIGLLVVGWVLGALATRGRAAGDTVWQIQPDKCIQCEQCAGKCVLTPSAVKCVHAYAMCGYCDLCFGFFNDQRPDNGTGAENQRCPTGAIIRSYVDDPYYQYIIDEAKCIGCAICVKGCSAFGNGSLFLQIRHDRCVNCNQCAIATACPSGAIVRVPDTHPYILKSRA